MVYGDWLFFEIVLCRNAYKGSNPFLCAIFVVRKSYSNEKAQDTGVTIRDYKKTKNILMGTPASGSAKRVR